MSYCNNNCRICDNIVISTAVTVITIDGTDTLVIDIPAGSYGNCCKYCLVVAQTIPTTATIAMPVSISIGGNTETVYPLMGQCCRQISASGIRTRTKYPVVVATTSTSGVFKSLRSLPCYPTEVLASLPAPAVATPAVAGGDVAVASFSTRNVAEPTTTSTKTTSTKTTSTKKEAVTNE